MNNTLGEILIWLNIFWPLLVTIIFLVLNKNIIGKIKFFIYSTIAGYSVILGINAVWKILYLEFAGSQLFLSLGENIFIYLKIINIIGILIIFVPPVIISYYIAKNNS